MPVARSTLIFGFLAIYLIWGSTYLAIRFGVETIPPFLLAGVRFILGGLIFYVWGRSINAKKPTRKQWFTTAVIGLFLLVGGNGLVSWAEMTVPSGVTALLIAMVPMWLVLFDWIRPGGQKVTRWVIVGLIIGFVGVVGLINPTDIGGLAEIDLFGALLIVLATILWASGSIYSRYADQPDSKIVSSGMQMITAGSVLLILSIMSGEVNSFDMDAVKLSSVIGLIYLITIGSVGFGAYIWLMKVSTPSKVATYAYVNPVIALLLGNVIAGETISVWTISCSVFILLSVILIITARQHTSGSRDVSLKRKELYPQGKRKAS